MHLFRDAMLEERWEDSIFDQTMGRVAYLFSHQFVEIITPNTEQ